MIATNNSADAVENADGVPMGSGVLGGFTVSVQVAARNGPNLVVSNMTVNNPTSAVMGTRFAGVSRVTVVNSGNQTAKGKIGIDLYASPTQPVPGGTPALESVTRNINLRPGARVVEVLPGFKWPTAPTGQSAFIVAEVDPTQTIAEADFADNFGISTGFTVVVAPVVDVTGAFTKAPTTAKAGRKVPFAFSITNSSAANVAAVGSVQIEFESSPDGLLADASPLESITRRVNLKPGKSLRLSVSLALSASAFVVVDVDPGNAAFPNDVNVANNGFATSQAVVVS